MLPAVREGRELLGVALGSTVLLALEITQVRVFSYALDPLLVFSAISVALLGMGAGGIAVALRPSLAREGSSRSAMAICALGFAISVIASHVLFARFSDRVGFFAPAGVFWSSIPLFGAMTIPYAFVGALVAIALSREVASIGRMYFANLAGSALGCAIVHPLLRPLGAEALVCAIAALSAWTAVLLSEKRLRTIAIVTALLASATPFFAKRLLPFRPDPRDLYGVARDMQKRVSPNDPPPILEVSRWDPLARVEVHAFPGALGLVNGVAPVRLFTQDGGAGSMLVDTREHPEVARALFEGTVYGGAYALRPHPSKTLIIGLGGAPDVLAALHHGASSIVGIEVNHTTIDVVSRDYATMLGDPYHRPGVTIVERDGRSFVEASKERFDVIQMTGADTYAAGSGGAFMFSESYLYTVEAFVRYVSALSDEGVLSIIRFGLEPLRVLSTEIAAMRALGIPDPERHVLVVRQGIWVNVLLCRRPFRDDEVLAFERAIAQRNSLPRVHIPVYDALGFGLSEPMKIVYAPKRAAEGMFGAILAAASVSGEDALLRTLDLDFTPVTDDRPFFFQFIAPRHLGRVMSSSDADYYVRGLRAHLSFLAAVLVLALLAILVPLAWLKRSSSEKFALARPLFYFAALGLGYLFVELTLMQRSALYLGHPTWSVVTTLLALLLGSGAGSAWSGRAAYDPRRMARGAALIVIVAIVVMHVSLKPLFGATAHLPLAAKIVLLALVTLPLGVAMGVPFPVGLKIAGGRARTLVAYGLGVNGFASVVASLVAVPVAMFSGFATVTLVAIALYLSAAILVPE